MDDRHERVNAIDRALADALDVAPSPDFVARVRHRVSREQMLPPFWRGWRIVVPALAASALLVIAAVVFSRPSSSALPLLPGRAVPMVQLQPAIADPVPTTAASSADARQAVRIRRAPAMPRDPETIVAASEPEVLVPREQIEMYRRLLAAAQDVPHAVVVESPKDIVAIRTTKDITIDPIKIDPIAPLPGAEGERR